MAPTPEDSRQWMQAGTALFLGEVEKLSDAGYAAPSALPGWTRKHLIGHAGYNASALRNLAHWAKTGEETPMYASTEQRGDDIAASAQLAAEDLRELVTRTATQLEADLYGLTEAQWNNEVRTAQGRTVPFTEVPWMRAREVMVHAVDLDTGITFAHLPSGFLTALVDDVAGKRAKGGGPALTVTNTDTTDSWEIAGEGEPVAVTGTLPGVAAWLARGDEGGVTTTDGRQLPSLPAWL